MELEAFLPILLGLAALVTVAIIAIALKPKKSGWKAKALANLAELETRINSGDQFHIKSALVDADKLLDFVMKSRGIRGETMGERLKNAEKYFDRNQYNRIWEAHKLRNRAVHEIDHNMSDGHIRSAFSDLRSAIRKLAS